MPSEPIVRRHFYSDPRESTLHPLVDPVTGNQIFDTTVRPLPTNYLETAINTGKYAEPLERMHNSGPHGWGIASGLSITATLNQAGVKVREGIAIDVNGRLIALAQGGKAEIGPNADNPAVSPQLVDVLPAGADLSTTAPAPLNGAFFVTITSCETLDLPKWGGVTGSDHEIPEMRHTPWLRLEPAANITDVTDDGHRVVLGRVQINAGNVTALTHERRREVSLPAGTVTLLRGATTAAPKADNIPTGDIRARAGGGIEVRVMEAAAPIDFHRLDTTVNPNVVTTIGKVSFGADQIVARRSDGKETVNIDSTLGNITLGTNGVEGDLLVRDKNNRLVITLDGNDAAIVVGAEGNEGDVLVKDNAGQNSVRIDGNTGTTFTKRIGTSSGNAIDVDTTFLRVHAIALLLDGSSGNARPFRALVDLDNRLNINYGTDYQNGVDINKLHLGDHVKFGYVEGFDTSKRPTYNQWITLEEFSTNLSSADWKFATTCSVGMLDDGSVDNFWWGVSNQSFTDANGIRVIKWVVNYFDRGDDWRPWKWHVTWMACRR